MQLTKPLLSALLATTALAQDQTRIPVRDADDLPRHSYLLPTNATELLRSESCFATLAGAVRRDLEADSARYDIRDRAELRRREGVMLNLDFLAGRLDAAATRTQQLRDRETQAADRLLALHWVEPYLGARATAAGDDTRFHAEFRRRLEETLRAMPWEVVGDRVLKMRTDVATFGENQLRGYVRSRFDPQVPAGGEVSARVAQQLVTVRFMLEVTQPLRDDRFVVYSTLLAENPRVIRDIWEARAVNLDAEAAHSPVVVAIWDTGTDVQLFPGQLWTNPAEQANGSDDDNNGFIDDIHGIAYDADSAPDVGLLHPLAVLHGDFEEIAGLNRGSKDLQAGVSSALARAYMRRLDRLTPDEYGAFAEDMTLWGIFVHGTHVAGIAAQGNPFIRLLTVRFTGDPKAKRRRPTLESARADAEATRQTVAYCRKHGVRVVNMSWLDARRWIENSLEEHDVGATPAERAELARKIYEIDRDALYEAIRSTPETLFVAAAGNSDDDIDFAELYPAGFELPNVLVVGAVDSAGQPTTFTSYGKTVRAHANGDRVENLIPGGERMRLSGTSMSAPAATNLAAKLLAVDPDRRPEEIIALIEQGAQGVAGEQPLPLLHPRRSMALLRAASKRVIDWSKRVHSLKLSLVLHDKAGSGRTTVLWDDKTETRYALRGAIEFTADDRGLRLMPTEAFFALRSRDEAGMRELDVRSDAAGDLLAIYRVDDRLRVFDSTAREWLAAQLLRLFRCHGYAVEQRTARLLSKAGADAVLDEIIVVESDRVRCLYLSELVRRDALTGPALVRALRILTEQIHEECWKAPVLREIEAAVPLRGEARAAYLRAVATTGVKSTK